MNRKNSIIDDIRNIDKIGFDNFCRMRKKELILVPLLIVAILVVTFTIIFKVNVITKSNLINIVEAALNENNSNKLAKVSKLGGEEVKGKDLEPLMKYYEKNKEMIKALARDLETSNGVGPISISTSNFIFWETNHLEIQPVNISVKTNYKNAKLKLNNKDIETNTRISGLTPGLYEIEASIANDLGELNRKEEFAIMVDEDIKMDLGVTKITIATNYGDAEVFVDGTSINKTADQIRNYGAFPNDGSVKVHLEKQFPWGNIKSEEFPIGEESILNIDINPLNEKLESDIKTLLNTFFTSTFDSLNQGKKELIENTYNEARDKIYDNLKKKSWILKNTYSLDELNIEIDDSQFRHEDERYLADIKVAVSYKVSKLFNLIQEEKKNNYKVNLIYYDGTWLVNDIEQLE